MNRPQRRILKIIMKTAAAMLIFAAPPIPYAATAALTNGAVTVEGPPIKTGLRPNKAVTGEVKMDVNRPNTGGIPIIDAIAKPYGKAINAATTPPERSPPNLRRL